MKRYRGIPITQDDGDDLREGRYYLIRVEPEQGQSRFVLSNEPGRTNMSREIRYNGWLGTTNNVAHYACGAVEVKGGRIKPIDVDVLVMAEEMGA